MFASNHQLAFDNLLSSSSANHSAPFSPYTFFLSTLFSSTSPPLDEQSRTVPLLPALSLRLFPRFSLLPSCSISLSSVRSFSPSLLYSTSHELTSALSPSSLSSPVKAACLPSSALLQPSRPRSEERTNPSSTDGGEHSTSSQQGR